MKVRVSHSERHGRFRFRIKDGVGRTVYASRYEFKTRDEARVAGHRIKAERDRASYEAFFWNE